MAMMGSAIASGENRAQIAAEQAVRSPLLEDVNLAGARGILVNITSTSSFTMDEYYAVMNTIKGFTAEDATVIIGNVVDDSMADSLRVTMVATGLGTPRLKKEAKPEMRVVDRIVERTGTDNIGIEHINYDDLDAPAVMRRGRREINQTVAASIDTLEIPAFLRKQAD
jgi:cell division protein FtsZ